MKKWLQYAHLGAIWLLCKIIPGKSLHYSLELALIYERLGLFFRSGRIYYKCIKNWPEDPRSYYGVAILYDNKKRYDKAVHWYKKALDKDDCFIPAWFFLANAMYELGNKHEAIDCYKKVIQLDSSNFWAYNNTGSIYEELDMNTEALRYFRKALEIVPGQHKALFNIGVVLSKMGYDDKACEYYWESIRDNNRYPYSFLNLSLLYKKEEKLDRAIIVISEGIRCNPEASFLYYNRACFLAMAGNTRDAFLDIYRAAKLNPSFLSYAEKDEDLENVRKLPGYQVLRKMLPGQGENNE